MSKVNEIHKSNLYGVIVETGISTATSKKLEDVAGASKSIYYSLQPYSKKFEEKRYGSFKRSVSKEFIEEVLIKEYNDNIGDINFISACSWQLNDDNDPLQISHGWFGIYDIVREVKYYFHFTFNRNATESYHNLIRGTYDGKYSQQTRDLLINAVGEIGINLIHTLISGDINEFNLNNVGAGAYISLDIAYKNNDVYLDFLISTLEKSNHDYFLTFIGNEPVRLEEFLRTGDKFIIQKGSFNPCHHGHINLMEISKKKHNCPCSFLISLYRYDKPHINSDEIKIRIKQINGLNYPLILCKSITFYETFSLLNSFSYSKKFNFPIGADTLIRINQTNIDAVEKTNNMAVLPAMRVSLRGLVNNTIKKYGNFKFLLFNRNGYEIPKEMDIYSPMCEYFKIEDDGVSSSKIREGLLENKLKFDNE
jgi:nicotinic acid mononucleotide adenylyltransferase